MRTAILATGAVALVIMLALGFAVGWRWARSTAPSLENNLAGSFALAERRVEPAVVKIEVETPHPRRRRFFSLPGKSQNSAVPPNDHSQGSGLILDSRGYIVTNRHVVHRAQLIQVTLSPGQNLDPQTFYGHIVGEDAETDLAVIKITAPQPLPVAELGHSARLGVGDWVLAIGSPFGLDNSVTAGIISGLHRSMDPSREFESFIQTDAPINPGNSGGPLVNLAGQVVGINTAIYTDTDGYQGVGFALPSDLVERVYPQLVKQGRVTRGSLGVYFESGLDPAVRRVYGISSGVPLSDVAAHGPAQKAGLRPGDVITSVNGAAVEDGDALMNAVAFLPIGDQVSVGYRRGGSARSVKVAVADRAQLYPDQAAPPPQPPAPPAPSANDLGIVLASAQGGAVREVTPDTFADRIGVRSDDIVIELNRQPVASRADLHRLSARLRSGEDVAIVVRRPNGDGTYSRWLLGGTLP